MNDVADCPRLRRMVPKVRHGRRVLSGANLPNTERDIYVWGKVTPMFLNSILPFTNPSSNLSIHSISSHSCIEQIMSPPLFKRVLNELQHMSAINTEIYSTGSKH